MIPVVLADQQSQPNHSSTRESYLRAHGAQSISYSVMQDGLSSFELSGHGILFYTKTMGHTLVLGNPLCSEDSYDAMLGAFLHEHKRVLFAQIDGTFVDAVRRAGLCVTPVGADSWIDLDSFKLTGKSKQDLRRYQNVSRNSNLQITEVGDTEAHRFELTQISRRWIETKSVSERELSFLIRPFASEAERDIRIFTASVGSRTVGFVVFDPIYRAGIVTGYTASILREESDAPKGCLDAVILHAIEEFRNEGVESLSLGVMPMHEVGEFGRTHGKGAWPLYLVCRLAEILGWSPFVNVSGLNFHKSRYRPTTTPVFVATTSPVGLIPMTVLTRACGLLP